MRPSSILWQNEENSVVLLDLPRSIEEAQVPSSQLAAEPHGKLRRLISTLPPASPFPTPEPKAGGSGQPGLLSPAAQVTELMTTAAAQSALDEIGKCYSGPWCLPRLCSQPEHKPRAPDHSPRVTPHQSPAAPAELPPNPHPTPGPDQPADHHQQPQHQEIQDRYHLPAASHFLQGTIQSQRAAFLRAAPKFNLIILDPPWPNRSAKRKRGGCGSGSGRGSYQPAADLRSIRVLLSSVPVAAHLAADGLVAVWVTNAPRFTDLLLRPSTSSSSRREGGGSSGGGGDGVFAEWGVELVGEWTWVKVTTGGEPVVAIDSAWRKPWERLLIARNKVSGRGGVGGPGKAGAVRGKVIVSVPDVHSRKPNLRGLFEGEEGLLPEGYEALEVFARNLTAGWWALGDQVLHYQRKECWVEEDEGGGTGNDLDRNSTVYSTLGHIIHPASLA